MTNSLEQSPSLNSASSNGQEIFLIYEPECLEQPVTFPYAEPDESILRSSILYF